MTPNADRTADRTADRNAQGPAYLEALLLRHLHALLGEAEAPAVALLQQHLQWQELPRGQVLMRQGEPGDAMYLLLSGRLRASIAGADGAARPVREITRGQIVGEMSLFTDEPRSATLVAIRDSVLVRLGKAEFRQLLGLSAQVSVALTRQVIHRLQTEGTRAALDRPVAIGLLPVSAGVDIGAFGQRLAAALHTALGGAARVAVVDAGRIDAELGRPGIARAAPEDAEAGQRIAVRLDEIEAAHDAVLLLADAGPTPWTQRCTRHADELLLLADASAPAVLHPSEQAFLAGPAAGAEASGSAAEILVLLHAAEALAPRGTAAWLARRPVAGHVHVRPALDADLARLARLQARTATGLVLAGGGARGLSHLGLWRALREHGVEIDVVGGTSIGAVMAVLVAADQPVERVTAIARRAFALKPTSDFNWLPLISLIKGRRLRRTVDAAAAELFGAPIDLEDLWKGCFVVASNYSQGREQVLQRGPLQPAMLASAAIPGALPPVIIGGDLLCDGGSFNNFPVDVMWRQRGIGQVIGADLHGRRLRPLDKPDVPGTWALLRDRLRPRARRRYRLPTLAAYLMNVTILYSLSRQPQAQRLCDLYFNPPLERVGMLQWDRFDHIVAQGHAHGCEVLKARAAAAAGPGPAG